MDRELVEDPDGTDPRRLQAIDDTELLLEFGLLLAEFLDPGNLGCELIDIGLHLLHALPGLRDAVAQAGVDEADGRRRQDQGQQELHGLLPEFGEPLGFAYG